MNDKVYAGKIPNVSLFYFLLALTGIFFFSQKISAQSNIVYSKQENNVYCYFIKDEIFQETSKLSFNVLRIVNQGNDDQIIKPLIKFPENWSAFSSAFRDTVVKARDSISLPVRFSIPSSAMSNKEYKVTFEGYSGDNKLILSNQFQVQLYAYHNWNIIIPQKRIHFNLLRDNTEFEVILRNNGNTYESIKVDINPDNKAKIKDIDDWELQNEIILAPNTDTTLRFEAEFTFSENRIFDISKIQIYARTEEKKIYRSVHIEKYSDKYAPFEIEKNYPHATEAGIRSFSGNDEILPFIKARGNSEFKNGARFKYNFTYYDLTETEDIIGNSYYNLLYSVNNLKIGMGAFSSLMGRNLYNRNSIMASNKLNLSKSSQLEAYASISMLEPNTSGAIGYSYKKEGLNLNGSAALNIDGQNKRNTASFIFHTNRLSIANNQEVSMVLYAYHENHYLTKRYTQTGIAWDLNYYASFGEKVELHLSNNYGSPDIPGRKKGLLNFYSRAKYKLAPKKGVVLKYINSSRDFYTMSYEGNKLPQVLLKDRYVNVQFHSKTNYSHRYYIGPGMETYESARPVSDQTDNELYKVKKYRIEYKGFFGRHLMLNLKYGFSNVYYKHTDSIKDVINDYHLLADLHFNGYGIRMAFDNGSMANQGLYQFAADDESRGINISPYLMKSLFRERIRTSIFTNYIYRFDLKYGYLNINPKIETYVFNDWYITMGGTYNFTHQVYNETRINNSFYYLEFSIKKRWGNSEYRKKKKDLKRVKVLLFRDENANGTKERTEKGIPNVKIRIQLKSTLVETEKRNLPVDLTLLTNRKGYVIFKNIPVGFYDLYIMPLDDLKEYFFIGKSTETLEVTRNSVNYIPFLKSGKISGNISLKRQKFVRDSESRVDLGNIRITAFNKKGDSYSTLTDNNGRFNIYAPGNNEYTVRMNNVFAKRFRILNNDAKVILTDTTTRNIEFKIVEKTRRVNFKKAKPTSKDKKLQKIKVLPGTVTTDSTTRINDREALPVFDIETMNDSIHEFIAGKYYIILHKDNSIDEIQKLSVVYREQGIKSYPGYNREDGEFYLVAGYFKSRSAARKQMRKIKRLNVDYPKILFYNPKENK